MTPTPRTDAEWQSITVSAPWDAAAEQMAQHARQLERELAAEREQVAILRSDEKRLVAFAKTYRMNAEILSDKLATERALADEMASQLDHAQYIYDPNGCKKALAAWKEARSESV